MNKPGLPRPPRQMPRRRPPGSESFHFLPFVVEKLSHEIESLHSSGHVITLSPAAALSPRRQIFCIAARPRRTGNHPYKCPAPGFSTFCRWAALLRPDARTVTTRFPVPWEPGNSAAPGSFSCPGASSPPPAGRPRADAPAPSPASPPAWRPAPPYGGRSAAASPSGTGGFPRSGGFYRRNSAPPPPAPLPNCRTAGRYSCRPRSRRGRGRDSTEQRTG